MRSMPRYASTRICSLKENPSDVEEGKDVLDYLNPNSLEIIADAKVEPSLANATPGTRYQFERLGYFCVDPDSKPGSRCSTEPWR